MKHIQRSDELKGIASVEFFSSETSFYFCAGSGVVLAKANIYNLNRRSFPSYEAKLSSSFSKLRENRPGQFQSIHHTKKPTQTVPYSRILVLK